MLSTSIRVHQRLLRCPQSTALGGLYARHVLPRAVGHTRAFYLEALQVTTTNNNPCGRPLHRLTEKPVHVTVPSASQTSPALFASSRRGLNSSKRLGFASISTIANAPVENDQYRLPTNVKPTHYDVTIKTDLEGLTFQGLVKIKYVSYTVNLSQPH